MKLKKSIRISADEYQLIAGERRFRASQLADVKTIPTIIKELTDKESLEIALIENLQREGLNPIEEAHAYQHLIDKFQMTQERISEILGKARTTITNTLRLLKLPQEIQEEIKRGRISYWRRWPPILF
jgi:ParB family chromosome partitioning protein